jgi:hypothetical protein
MLMQVIEYKLNNIVRTLEQSIYESEMAIGDNEKGYPYAAGYARSALKMVLDDVKNLQELIEMEKAQMPDDSYIMDNDYAD